MGANGLRQRKRSCVQKERKTVKKKKKEGTKEKGYILIEPITGSLGTLESC
jgi:hypothetical protein